MGVVLDVSKSFKRLQAEKLAADQLIRELTPLDGMVDIDGLGDYLRNLMVKVEVCIPLSKEGYLFTLSQVSQQEIKHLNGTITRENIWISRLADTN
jgi:hypothetical protein